MRNQSSPSGFWPKKPVSSVWGSLFRRIAHTAATPRYHRGASLIARSTLNPTVSYVLEAWGAEVSRLWLGGNRNGASTPLRDQGNGAYCCGKQMGGCAAECREKGSSIVNHLLTNAMSPCSHVLGGKTVYRFSGSFGHQRAVVEGIVGSLRGYRASSSTGCTSTARPQPFSTSTCL